MSKLTPKQEKFCLKYIETGNASEAYRLVYSTKKMKPETVNRNAKALLDNSKISTRLEQLKANQLKRHEVTVDRIIDEYRKIAFADIRQLQSAPGVLVPLEELDDDTAGALNSVKLTNQGKELEYRLNNKVSALNDLAKIFGMFEKDNEQKLPDFSQIKVEIVD